MYEKFTCLFWNSNYTTDIEVILHYYYYTNTARVLFLYKSYKEFFSKMTRGKQHKWLNVLSQNIITKLRKIRLNRIPIEYKVSSYLPIRGQKRTEIET